MPYQTKAGNIEFKNLEEKPIAYFCAEYGIEDDFSIYAGGLGILAGDFILEAGERGVPFVAIGLAYHYGFKTHGNHTDVALDPAQFDFFPLQDTFGKEVIIPVEVDDRLVYARTWVKAYGGAHLFLLDTNVSGNSESDRRITDYLYDGRFEIRILQELILGVGGVKLLRTLGITPSIYHLNEGHTSFAILALALEYLHDHPTEIGLMAAVEAVRPKIVATKHTILPLAGLHFTKEQFATLVAAYFKRHKASFDEFFSLGFDEPHTGFFSTTSILMRSAIRSNAVSMLHAVFEKREHPESKLISITNGVNIKRWLASNWESGDIARFSDRELWEIHARNRRDLARALKKEDGVDLNPEALTIVWARRFAAYKRPHILFSDLDRLAAIVSNVKNPVQFIVSGRGSASDIPGVDLVKKITNVISDARFKNKVVYFPNYSICLAKKLVAGADVWLSTPERGKEACGTSSMKSGLNGVLQISTSDGWIEEVDWTDKGWILPEENIVEALYKTLENDVIPEFYSRDNHSLPEAWVSRMRRTMSMICERYSSSRMLEEYLNQLYFPNSSTPYQLR